MLRFLSVLFLTLIAPVAAARAATPAQTQKQLASIEQATEKIRQLTHVRPVVAKFPTRTHFNKIVRTSLRQGTTDRDFEIGQREDVLLGFLSKSDDLKSLVLKGFTSQVVGLYSQDAKVLYVPREQDPIFGIDRHDVAHEYTHALQDQHFNLRKILPDNSKQTYRNSDAILAHRSLVEGDAFNTEQLFILRTYSAPDLRKLLNELSHVKSPSLPKSLERQFEFPYTTGLAYVQALFHSGGMKAIDAAYGRLPRSTYEVMYPKAYRSGWKPLSVQLHGVTGWTDWTQADDDVLGAMGYNTLIWQTLGRSPADSVTRAYRGDRYIYLEKGTDSAMRLESAWTTSKTARAAQSALIKAVSARFQASTQAGKPGKILTYGSGAAFFRLHGKRLTIAYAPTPALAKQLGMATTT